MEQQTEQPGDGRTGHAQQSDLQNGQDAQRRDGGKGKAGGGNAAGQRDAVGQQGRTEPGHERHREAQAHILHHHGEEGSRQRGAEQGGEERGHAADRGRAAVMVREMEQLCNIVADAAAHLQGRALSAGGAAAQVGEHRAKEDGGHQQRADGLAALHGPDDIVGANALALGSLIKGYDGKARRGQQPEQPAVGTPQLGDGLYRQMERGADAAAQQADGQGQHQPAQQHPGHLPGGAGSAGERFAHKIHILTGKIFAVPL